MTDADALLRAVVAEQPYPLLFATVSGAHLYGFPSPDSDYDLRGVHVLPLREVVLMRTGELEANLVTLNDIFRLPYLPELLARKLAGPEQGALADDDIAPLAAEYTRLRGELEAAREASRLPDEPQCRAEVNDLLVRVRLEQG